MKNPFAPAKHTTVRRDPLTVYPERKGLRKPDFLGTTPLDKTFQDLERLLQGDLSSFSVESLAKSMEISTENPQQPVRLLVTRQLLQQLLLLRDLSIEAKARASDKDLLTVSLHDMKTFGKLVSVLIVVGIAPPLAALGAGIPLEKRRLKDFGLSQYKPLQADLMASLKGANNIERFRDHVELLHSVYTQLGLLFSTPSDVRDLLMKGMGYLDYLVVALTLACAPCVPADLKQRVQEQLPTIEALAQTYDLYLDYTVLVAGSPAPYFHQYVLGRLQLIPYNAPKGDGVLSLVEFVLGLRDGGDVTTEKLDHVTRVLLTKPAAVSTRDYFTSIGNQCYELLVNVNRPTIATCITHFLDLLWLKNPRIVNDFVLCKVRAAFDPDPESEALPLVSEKDLNNAFNVCLAFSEGSLPTDLLEANFGPILPQLWAYYCYREKAQQTPSVVQNVLVLVFTLMEKPVAKAHLQVLAQNLVADFGWQFRAGPNLLVEIGPNSKSLGVTPETRVANFMADLDRNCEAFVAILLQLEDQLVLLVFSMLLKRWSETDQIDENPFAKLSDIRLLERIGSELKERLAQTPGDILSMVDLILAGTNTNKTSSDSDDEEVDSDDEDEPADTSDVVLQLLSAVISETKPSELDADCRATLSSIQNRLKSSSQSDTRTGLASRILFLLSGEAPVQDRLEADKRQFERAIASINDPLVPIRAHGLFLLRELVEQHSEVVSVDFAVSVHLVQLRDPEPFVYLNVIKGLDSLLASSKDEVLPVLLDIYTAPAHASETKQSQDVADSESLAKEVQNVKIEPIEESTSSSKPDSEEVVSSDPDLDERLRIGEVLLRFVQAQDEAFVAESAALVTQATLSLIRRSKRVIDDRLRMSAMSILGLCCTTNILAMSPILEDALDCALGILTLETLKQKAIMRRSAIVLIHDMVTGTSNSENVPFPRSYMLKVVDTLRYIQGNDTDLLVREQAQTDLDYIQELAALAWNTDEAT